MTGHWFLGIDQGTTSTRAIVFDGEFRTVASAARRLEARHPQPGWVELDPLAIRDSVIDVVAEVLEVIGGVAQLRAVGLANQGETVVAWDSLTLAPLAPAITWQCRRSTGVIERMRAEGLEPRIRALTGLPLDPYFSAGKLRWLLEEDDAVRQAAAAGTLRFGTVDAWLTASLGAGDPAGYTDPSTASRTQLFGLARGTWEPELLDRFGIDPLTLPVIVPTAGHELLLHHPSWDGPLRLTAMACDQQAALAGHGAFRRGDIKATYGTGAFVLANAGREPVSRDGLETSIAWTLSDRRTDIVVQGGEYSAGALLDWLRDDLALIDDVSATDAIASSVNDAAGVIVVPSLVGLGAPWYRPEARAAIVGLTSAATRAHVVRATLDAIAHRVTDIVEVMDEAIDGSAEVLRVDGGLARNAYLMQSQADRLGRAVAVATVDEATALGVAGLAAIGSGHASPADLASFNPVRTVFRPALAEGVRLAERAAWRSVVDRLTAAD